MMGKDSWLLLNARRCFWRLPLARLFSQRASLIFVLFLIALAFVIFSRGGFLRGYSSPVGDFSDNRAVFWHNFSGTYNTPFLMALPDPKSDHNTQVIMQDVYEDALGDVFRVMLSGRCTPDAHVLDIGSNLGIFTGTSAAFGCRVTAVEAQTRLVPYIRDTVRANGWDERVTVLNVAAYDAPGNLRIAYYDARAHGWLSMAMDAASLAACPSTPGCAIETVPVVRADTLIVREHLLIKIDVDGPEAVITRALLPALRKFRAESILIEVCPTSWGSMISRADGLAALEVLMLELQFDLVILNQINFEAYKPDFLARCKLIEGVFRPRAYAVPPSMLRELFDDSTTAVNCKNVVFTNLHALMLRFATAGGTLDGVAITR